MIIEQIKNWLHNGLRPFTVELSNGKNFQMLHEDFIALHPKAIVIIDQEGISHTINPLHIVSLDEAAHE